MLYIFRYSFILLAILCSISACSRVKSKTKGIVKNAVDKVFPVFDASQPDTKYNRKRFKEFFGVALSPDVRGIYCNAERFGQDATYQFAFNCNGKTAKRIIDVNHFAAPDNETGSHSFSNLVEFDWWQQGKIDSLPVYFWHKNDLYRYFWYDSIKGNAYYVDFDI